MYCNKCGQENPYDAVYCKKCGSLVESEDETRVAARDSRLVAQRNPAVALDSSGEAAERIFSVTPTVKFVMAGYLMAVVAAFILVALLSIFLKDIIPPVLAVLFGLALLLIPAFYHLKKKLVRYTLTDTTIEIDRGLISRTTQNIPLRRVQDVTVTATIFQRLLGYGDIEIDNASEDNNRIVLDDIDSPKRYAEMILRQMRLLDK